MTHQNDIVARLRAVPAIAFEHAGQLGIEDPSLAHEAAATIEALRAELAGRDAEIAAWLRKGTDTYPHGTYARCRELHAYWTDAADMIERGVYRGNAATAIASGAYREPPA